MTEASAALAVQAAPQMTIRERIAERLSDARELAMKAAGVLVLAGVCSVALVGCSDDGETKDTTPPTAAQAAALCRDTQWGHPAANADRYDADAFFPHTDTFLPKGNKALDTPEEVADYKADLFREPLAGKGEKASFAFLMTQIIDPFTRDNATPADYDYKAAYRDKLNAYNAPGGKKLVERDCRRANKVIREIGEYDPEWAGDGLQITRFIAVRGDVTENGKTTKNAITDMEVKKGSTSGTVRAIVFKRNGAAKHVTSDAPAMALIINDNGQWDGEVWSRDVTIGEGRANAEVGGTEPEQGKPVTNPVPGGENPFAGGTSGETKVDQTTGTETTTGTDKNGNKVTVVRNPITGETTITTTPAGGGTPTVTVVPTNPGPTCGGNSCPPTTAPSSPNGPGTSAPGTSAPGTSAPGTTAPGTTVPGTTPTTRPAPTTTQPAPTTTRPAPTTTAVVCVPPKVPAPTGGCKDPSPPTTAPTGGGF